MKKLMENCAVPDFRLEDIVNTDAKRTCRILSAILNFIKFHVHMAREGQELEEVMGQQLSELASATHRNAELKQKLGSMQRQKQEEREHEEELEMIIAEQEDLIQRRKEQEVTLRQHLQDVEEQLQKETQKKAILDSGLDKSSQRTEDLRKQIVTSPDKLRARLVKLQQEVEEIKSGTQDSDRLKRMWESLATRAQHIPNHVLKGLDEDMEALTMKTNKASDLESHFTEAIEEKIARQKQTLKEVSSKNQNLVRHLKFVAKEAHEVAYDDQKMLSSQSSKSELERDVYQLQTQVHALQVSEELFARKMDTVKEKLEMMRTQHEERCQEAQTEIDSLVLAVQSYVEKCNMTSVALTP
ncbi:hypothetical protein GBAR_LOCUS23123 [Geodia barretti]|uniref:Kinetochore protein Nuf2 N-terminal domain-containing protein n=3 Tax=Geodia barretti TaxID=519541 RepID=A0AA35T5H5_GEOBA|nr:hypothetical protein GBAR_LOCUS23123 [Geodia barretti]